MSPLIASAPSPVTHPRRSMSPVRTLIILSLLLYVAETVVMFIFLPALETLGPIGRNFGDSTLMVILASPALYLFVLRPLHRHIAERRVVEEELQQSRELLEETVAQRTADLQVANASLQREIAEHRAAEAALRESEAQFRMVFEHSNDAVFWADADSGAILRCNRQAEALVDRTRAELVGQHHSILHPADRQARSDFHLATTVTTMQNIEAEVLSRAGKRIPVLISTSVVTIGAKRIIQGVFRDITERKATEESLRASEELARLAMEASRAFAFTWIPATDEIRRSQNAAAILGLDPGLRPETRRGYLARIHPDDRGPLEGVVAELTAASDRYTMTYRLLRANGETATMQESVRGFFNDRGRLEQVVGMTADITDLTRAEAALRANEARLRALTLHTPAIIHEIDRLGIVRFANRGPAGVTRERVVGTPILSWFPVDQQARVSAMIERVFATAQAASTEYTMPDTEGQQHTYLATFSPVVILDETTAVALTAFDISDRKRAEEALEQARAELERKVDDRTARLREINTQLSSEIEIRRKKEAELIEAERRYRTVAEFTHDWEYWEAPDHTLRYCSPSCESVTGYRSDELIADPRLLERMVCEEDRTVWRNHRHDHRAPADSTIVEFRIRARDGGIRWLEHACRSVIDQDGTYLGVRAGNRDITERRAAELEMQRLRQEIAHVTRTTTVGQLAASLAHELNQPLAAILCNAEAARSLLAMPSVNLGEVRNVLNEIVEDDQRAGEVIRRLRALFNKEAKEHQPLDINELVRETLSLLHSELLFKNVALDLETQPDLPPVRGNRIELQQVILNLVLNSADAMADVPPGRRQLHVRTSRPDAGTVHIAVRDHGIGLPADLADRIWDAFFTTKATGMGMGLAVSRTIVESHNGRLWAFNNADHGTTFCFSLPISREDAS